MNAMLKKNLPGVTWSGALPWVIAAVAAILSLVRKGYNVNVVNNVYHLPIILKFSELPQFRDDPFVLSLGKFFSPVYPFLSLFTTEQNLSIVLFIGLAINHFLMFFALLRIVQACGQQTPRGQILLVAMLLPLPLIYGFSDVGRDALLINYFSHTELAQPFALLSLASLLRGRPVMSAVQAGIAFALNAFIGVWVLPAIAAMLLHDILSAKGKIEFRSRLKALILAAIGYAIPAAPIAIWVLRGTAGDVVDFDYRDFLWRFYPYHFFIQASSLRDIFNLACMLAAGVVAARQIGGETRRRIIVLAGVAGVVGAGAVIGGFVGSRLVLNLHLIRADGLLQVLCLLFVLLRVLSLISAWNAAALASAVIIYAGLMANVWLVVAIGLLLAGWAPFQNVAGRWLGGIVLRLRPVQQWLPHLAGAGAVAAVAAVWLVRTAAPAGAPLDRQFEGFYPQAPEWRAVQIWARQKTDQQAIFLVPPYMTGFRTGAQRREWVEYKDGAAPMWEPSFFRLWNERMAAVGKLRDADSRNVYACAHGIDYVVHDLRSRKGAPIDTARAVYLNRWFEVHRASC